MFGGAGGATVEVDAGNAVVGEETLVSLLGVQAPVSIAAMSVSGIRCRSFIVGPDRCNHQDKTVACRVRYDRKHTRTSHQCESEFLHATLYVQRG